MTESNVANKEVVGFCFVFNFREKRGDCYRLICCRLNLFFRIVDVINLSHIPPE